MFKILAQQSVIRDSVHEIWLISRLKTCDKPGLIGSGFCRTLFSIHTNIENTNKFHSCSRRKSITTL